MNGLKATSAALLLFLLASSAHAQMSDGEKKAAARAAYMEGVDLQNKGKPSEALTRFEAAEKLFDAPTHLLHIAECQALTGHLVDASEMYETLIRKQLPKDSPAVFFQAQEQGKAELAALKPRIPSMRVTVKPDPASLQNLQISLNDRQIPNEVIGLSRPVNPGPYRISATASGYASQPIDIEVKESEPKSIEITLHPAAPPVAAYPGAPAAVPVAVAVPGAPPPYEANQPPPPKPGPSSTGFLFGVRPGVFVPNGNVAAKRSFDRLGSAGGGVGFDAMARVAKILVLGGTLELASLGPPASDTIAEGVKADGKTTTSYIGFLVGLMPNVDKVTFLGDVGFGYRKISRDEKLTTGGVTTPETHESYGGISLALGAGLSIPVGPFRVVPKGGLSFGTTSCSGSSFASTTTSLGSCVGSGGSGSFSVVSATLGLYYHLDTAKKPAGS